MKSHLIFLLVWVIIDACVDRIDFEIPTQYSKDIVVDGLITNEPGPYTVKLSTVIKSDDTRSLGIPIYAKKVSIFDNLGNSEELKQAGEGVYKTMTGGIQGVVGREYYVRIEMENGNVFESIPDRMNPVGAVDSIYYEFESYQPLDAPTGYQYRIFINAHSAIEGDNYIRWRFNGTYVVQTLPQFTQCNPPCYFCPALCSGFAIVNGVPKEGYAYNPITGQPEYVIGLKCTCCRCWVTPREEKLKVSDTQISANGKFSRVEMGIVPVNFYTFFEKYRVEIQQMSLSRAAFEYWKAVQSQKEAVGSLFQPVSGEIPTNLFEINNERGVQGIFYASAVTKKQIYLDQRTHPVKLTIKVPESYCAEYLREGPIGKDCRLAFPGSTSTTQKPADWKF